MRFGGKEAFSGISALLTLVNRSEFRKGNYLAALRKYSEQWNSYLPYHVDAFPKDHPLRTKLGEVQVRAALSRLLVRWLNCIISEASLFNSMSACLTKLGNRSLRHNEIQQGSLVIEQAFRCIWVVMELREFATVRSIYSSCKFFYEQRRSFLSLIFIM